jgi:DNA-binding GntR family transcriptional regulator
MKESNSQVAAGSVYEVLKAEIATAKLGPGAALKQDHIAARFGVSHVPVREALSRLVAGGLATARLNKGTSVSALSAAAAVELVELRWLLEGRLIELAVPNLSRADISRASQLLDQLSEAEKIEDAFHFNHAFHTSLYAKADRPLLLQSVESARLNLGRYLYLPWKSKRNADRSKAEHRRLLDLCLAGDAAGAKALVTEHVISTGQLIVEIINHQVVQREAD